MADKQTQEMTSAYAAGCLDVDNFINFKEYLKSEGDLPHSELGELQNVMALLSISGDMEQPPAELKTSVAKKLISLKSEIKAKIKAERNTVDSDFSDKKKTFNKAEEKPDIAEKKNSVSSNEHNPKAETRKKTKEKISASEPTTQTKTETKKLQEIFYAEDVETKSKTASRSRLGFFIAIAAVILILFSFYYSYNRFSDTKKELKKMNLLLKETKAEVAEAKHFIYEHKKLLNFFSYNNVAVVNFKNRNQIGNYSGKLFISFDKTFGLLMVNNLPELISGEMYQLWLVSRGRSYPVISFIPQKHTNYINISELPSVNKTDIDMFRVTVEKKPNPDIPEGETLLIGQFAR